MEDDGDQASRLEVLLGDIRDGVWEHDKIASAVLVDALIAIQGRPWAEYGKTGKPLTQNKLARLLNVPGLRIAPENVRFDNGQDGKDVVLKGYHRHQFADAFARYLGSDDAPKVAGDVSEPPDGGPEPLHRYKAHETRTKQPFQTATPDPDVAVRKCEKPNNDGLCSGVADGVGEKEDFARERENGVHDAVPNRTCLQCNGAPDGKERLVEIEGRPAVWLHPVCERFYLTKHGLKRRTGRTDRRDAAWRAVGSTPPGTTCIACHLAEGTVMKIASGKPGAYSEPLHEACAVGWFASIRGDG